MPTLLLADAPTFDITGAVTSVISIAGSCVTFIGANPLCMLFIGASVVGIGFGIFKKAKHSAN
jgi:hypothetical protein